MDKKNPVTIEQISSAVIERFIETGDESTIKQIAERLNVSVSSVRRRLNTTKHFVPGCHWTKTAIDVDALQPSRARLARMIRELRKGA